MKILKKKFYKDSFTLLKATAVGFGDDKVSKLSAALSYYTIFALAPLLLIVLAVVSFVLGDDAQQGKIFQQINEFVGPDAAALIQSLIQNLSVGKGSVIASIIGIGTLIFASTKVFVEMQDSLNLIFNVKPKPKRGWVKLLTDRVLSFSIVLILGFLLVVSLLLNVVISFISTTVVQYLPHLTIFGFDLLNETTNVALYLINTLITFIVLSLLFGCIFKFLPDVKIKWKDVRAGAFFTAVLFMIGKWAIGLYMQYAAPASGYGAAGSLVIILLWINYTSSILFFGAEFTEKNAELYGAGIKPSSIAVRINQTEDMSTLKTQRTPSRAN